MDAMPFTFSHPALVVPFRRIAPLSALVVGSVIPDLPYFVPKLPDNQFAHDYWALIFFCLPAGLLALWVFHAFLKEPIIALLPVSHQRRLSSQPFAFLPWRRFALVSSAIVFGAVTHLTWDDLTHQDSWAVKQLPILRGYFSVGTREIARPVALEHLSSLIGLLLLCFWYWRWLAKTDRSLLETANSELSARQKAAVLGLFAAVALAPSILILWDSPMYFKHGRTDIAGVMVVLGLKILFLEIVGFSLLWHMRQKALQATHARRA